MATTLVAIVITRERPLVDRPVVDRLCSLLERVGGGEEVPCCSSISSVGVSRTGDPQPSLTRKATEHALREGVESHPLADSVV